MFSCAKELRSKTVMVLKTAFGSLGVSWILEDALVILDRCGVPKHLPGLQYSSHISMTVRQWEYHAEGTVCSRNMKAPAVKCKNSTLQVALLLPLS